MAEITAAMVKELREKTDAPMMECKRALSEATGDMTRAEEILRVKLGSKASKAATRVTAEGLIGLFISPDAKQGAVIEVNCETDFVAKNDDFVGFVNDLAKLIATSDLADVAAVAAAPMGDGTVDSIRTALIGKIGENISIRRFQRFVTGNKLSSYVHSGKIGVLVDYSGADEVGKDLAMHIAATKPRAVDETGVSETDKEAERSVARLKAAESGKPAEIVEKMVEGSVQKNDKQSVAQMLKEKNAAVANFALFIVGEGIEKKTSDFAAEVAAAAAGTA